MRNTESNDDQRMRLRELARVFDYLPVGFAAFDLDRRFVYVNQSLADGNGLPTADHMGRTVPEILPIIGPDADQDLQTVLATGEPVVGEASRAGDVGGPGRERFFQYTYAALKDDNDEIFGLTCMLQDVSEHKRAQDASEASQVRANAALAEHEERLELALDAASIGVWSWDLLDGSYYWDSRMLAMSGLKLQEQTGVMEDDFVRSLHPDDEAMVTAAVQRSLDGVADYDIEYRIIRRDDGAVRDINARALVIRDEAGKPIKMTGVAMDVTEQKRNAAELQLAYTTLELRVAERTLTLKEANEKLQTEIAERERAQAKTRESEAFITTVMSNMVDALITIDENGRISSFNQAAEDIFGYDVDDIVGQKINILMPEPDHSEHDRYIADYMRTGQATIIGKGPREIQGRHKDGRILSLELAITRTSFGGQPLFVGALRDISERKRLEELFQIVAEHSPNSIILKDLQGRFLLVNRRVEEWLGISAQDIIGKTAYEIYPGNYADDAIAEDLVVIRTRQTSSREWEIKFADGNMHVIASTKFPVSDSNGQIIGVGTIGMDVSDLRAAEMQLRQAQKMEALGQLTGGIAHDFNNLLAIMMGNLSLLREDLGPEHASAELVEPTMRAIDQAAALTERMLAFSRQQPLKVQAVDANELLRDMSPLIKRSLIEDIDVVFDLADELNQCRIDPGQLEQAILNLSINARDAMSQGGRLRIGTMDVSFTAEEDGRPVDLLPGDYVLISVSDDGTGIPDHILDRIFDPFFTTKTVGEGTGLGLSMVYGFVKQSNGHIAVTTGPDEGTTFRIYLAAEAGPAPSGDATDGGPVAAANNETILVVEDDGDVRAMVSLILKKQGYQVLLANDGREGLASLAENPDVDLLLTDILLPGGMNGRQVAHSATAERAGLKVLFMSGYSRDAIVHHGRLDPEVQLLSKPFSPEILAHRVRDILDS